MKKIVSICVVCVVSIWADGIKPTQYKLEMAKNCQVLMLSETPDTKAYKQHTSLSTGDCVQNMGCIRGITQKELESADAKKRPYLEWQNPIWCKVSTGKKQGWVQQQFLKEEPCEEF